MESLTTTSLVALGGLSALTLLASSAFPRRSSEAGPSVPASDLPTADTLRARRKVKWSYLVVYALVMMADWLQGPYIFSLYHDEFGLGLHTVAVLFVVGFGSAALFAPVVGKCADVFGRKRICLVFVVAYTLSCLVKFSAYLPTLFFGRLLGGLATSILFSSFESWLVSSSHALSIPSLELSTYLGRLTFVNGAVAVLSGVVADGVVQTSGTFKSPFAVSAGLLVLAGAVIVPTWDENYGGVEQDRTASLRSAVKVLWSNWSILMLLLVNTIVESVTYCWVFLWVAILQDTRTPEDAPLPLGRMFSCFMGSMVLGSLIYDLALKRLGPDEKFPEPNPTEEEEGQDESAPLLAAKSVGLTWSSPTITFHGWLACALLFTGGTALSLSGHLHGTKAKLIGFIVFEGSLGLFYPVMANLRAAMFPDECRATLTALFRLPFNLLVTIALVSGLEEHRTAFLRVGGIAVMWAAKISAGIAWRSMRARKPSGGH